MAWTAPRTWVAAEVVTAALMNTHLRDNLLETTPAKVTTAGDTVYATAANAIARLAIGAAGTLWRSTGTAPEWADPEDGAKLDGDKLDIDFTPSNYTPSAAPAEADDVDDLAAHLSGIDTAIGNNLISQATQAAIEAETNENTYIPPDLLKHTPGAAKRWVRFNHPESIQTNYNCSGITDEPTAGEYTISWSNTVNNPCGLGTVVGIQNQNITVKTIATTSTVIQVYDADAGTQQDAATGVTWAEFGDL